MSVKTTASAASAASSYLGHTATRCQNPNGTVSASTATWLMTRSMHWARDTIVNPILVFPNFWVDGNNGEQIVGAGTIKASIEYPSGTITQCTGGTVTLANGLTSLTCPVTIPNGARFWIRSLQINSNGIVYVNTAYNVSDPSEGSQFGTGTPTDQTASGTVATAPNRALTYTPLAILSQTIKPSVLIYGDSRIMGHGDSCTDNMADVGNLPRALGPAFGYTKFAGEGVPLAGYIAGSNTYRQNMRQYFSHVASCLSGADLQVTGATAASVATLRASFAALFPNNTVFGVTMPPTSSSTDTWATTANQTQGTIGALVQGFNTLVRAGIAGERFYFDLGDAADPYRTGIWPVAYNPAATSGTAGFATTDGQHETATMNQIIAKSGFVKTGWITR